MKIRLVALLILSVCLCYAVSAQTANALHTPEKGSAERKAIMDALREEYLKGSGQRVVFQVNHLKVHQGWAWADVTPLDDKGKAVGEGGPNLLRYEKGAWVVVDLSGVEDDPDDPLGPMDPTPRYIKNLQKKYPGVPADVFPARRK
ncbi:MAG: hypothetical protein ACJ74J_18790 [Blastocatellia bacterium]